MTINYQAGSSGVQEPSIELLVPFLKVIGDILQAPGRNKAIHYCPDGSGSML